MSALLHLLGLIIGLGLCFAAWICMGIGEQQRADGSSVTGEGSSWSLCGLLFLVIAALIWRAA